MVLYIPTKINHQKVIVIEYYDLILHAPEVFLFPVQRKSCKFKEIRNDHKKRISMHRMCRGPNQLSHCLPIDYERTD